MERFPREIILRVVKVLTIQSSVIFRLPLKLIARGRLVHIILPFVTKETLYDHVKF